MEAPGFTATILIAVVMLAAAIVVAVVTVRTADGRIGRNQIAGVRTTATLASDEAWHAAHRAARRPTLLGCAFSGVFALALVGCGDHAAAFLVLLAASVITLTAGVGYGAWVGHRAAQDVGREAGSLPR